MCIINEPVARVANTNLLGARLQDLEIDGKHYPRQLTIYSNEVTTEKDNQMILPFPLIPDIPAEKQLSLFDISSLKDAGLFDSLSCMFFDPNEMICDSIEKDSAHSNCRFLPVIEVGSYLVTCCYSIEDLKRVDRSVFVMSSGVNKLLRHSYPNQFGFLICKLNGSKESYSYEPFAYAHCIPPSLTATELRLFLPTKHFHPHSSGWFFSLFRSPETHDRPDWDHNIYIMNYEKGLSSSNWCWKGTVPGYLWSQLEAITGPMMPCNSFYKCTMTGIGYLNEDLYVNVH
jgi:hypothetical protein